MPVRIAAFRRSGNYRSAGWLLQLGGSVALSVPEKTAKKLPAIKHSHHPDPVVAVDALSGTTPQGRCSMP